MSILFAYMKTLYVCTLVVVLCCTVFAVLHFSTPVNLLTTPRCLQNFGWGQGLPTLSRGQHTIGEVSDAVVLYIYIYICIFMDHAPLLHMRWLDISHLKNCHFDLISQQIK